MSLSFNVGSGPLACRVHCPGARDFDSGKPCRAPTGLKNENRKYNQDKDGNSKVQQSKVQQRRAPTTLHV